MTRAMTHEDVRARLSEFMDGVLSPREAGDLAAHLAECAVCAARLAETQSIVAILRNVEPVAAPDGFAASVRARIEQMGAARPLPKAAGPAAYLSLGRRSWRPAAAAIAVAAACVFVLNGIRGRIETTPPSTVAISGDQQAESARSARAKVGAGPAPEAASPAPPLAAQQQAPDQSAPGMPGGQSTRQYLVRTGRLAVEVDVFDHAFRRVEAIAGDMGGIVASSSVAEAGREPRGTFVVRVPAERFADATRRLEALGRVRTREYRTQDVGEEYVDVDSRLRNLQRQEARLLSFMERASRIPDLVAIETEVSRVRGEIEQLTGRRRHLANRIALATIEIEITQKPAKKPGGFWDVDRTISRLTEAFLGSVLEILGMAEGLAAIAARITPLVAVAGLGWMIVRRWAGRRFDPL